MNKLESILALVIMLLVLVLIGASCHIYDLRTENMKQRIALYEACAQDYGVRNCTF